MIATEQLNALSTLLCHGDVSSLFQPIFQLSTQRVLGYEALTRGPSNSSLHSPLTLFATARQAGRLSELERVCRGTACRRFRELSLSGKLFLNVSPEVLLEPDHQPGTTLHLLQSLGITAQQVVIELTEQSPTDDVRLLDTALHHYRDMGFSIALDDLGAGYSSLRLWSQLRPEYVKIDRHFIDGIHRDPLKREFVDSILNIARAADAQVIAEGIELEAELRVLAEMGVDLVQGYLLGRPQSVPMAVPPGRPSGAPGRVPPQPLTALVIPHPALNASATLTDALDWFNRHPEQDTLPIVTEQGRTLGSVQRRALYERLLSRPSEIEIRSLGPLLERRIALVDASLSPDQAWRMLTAIGRKDTEFVLVDDGRYLGLGRIVDLLELLTGKARAQRDASWRGAARLACSSGYA